MNIFEFLKTSQEEQASATTGAAGGIGGTMLGANLGERAKKPISNIHVKGSRYLEADIRDAAKKSRGKTFQYGNSKIKNNPKAINDYVNELKKNSKNLSKIRGGRAKTILALLGGLTGAGALMKGEKALKTKSREMQQEERRRQIIEAMRRRAAMQQAQQAQR